MNGEIIDGSLLPWHDDQPRQDDPHPCVQIHSSTGDMSAVNCDNSNPFVCQYSNIDTSKFGQWAQIDDDIILITDNSAEYKSIHDSICIGGTCDERENAYEWFLFIEEQKTWHEALANCQRFGGQLFFDFDGSLSTQARAVVNSVNGTWVGITDFLLDDNYMKMNGLSVTSEVFWADGRPSDAVKDFVFLNKEGYANVGSAFTQLASTCQLHGVTYCGTGAWSEWTDEHVEVDT